MVPILFALGSLVVWWMLLATYHGTMALVARRLGIGVREVNVGVGPTLATRQWFGIETWRFKLVPLGGFTRFYSSEDEDWSDTAGTQPVFETFDAASLSHRLLVIAVGPISVLTIGLALLNVPALAGHPQLTLAPTEEALPAPVRVAGLSHQAELSTLEGQLQLCLDTAGYYLWRLLTFQSLDGWGGWIALTTACGQVGAHSSWLDWLTLMGVVATAMGCSNLIPLPLLNGFRIVSALIESVFGKARLLDVIWLPLAYPAMLVYVIWYGRVIWLDARWVWAAVSG